MVNDREENKSLTPYLSQAPPAPSGLELLSSLFEDEPIPYIEVDGIRWYPVPDIAHVLGYSRKNSGQIISRNFELFEGLTYSLMMQQLERTVSVTCLNRDGVITFISLANFKRLPEDRRNKVIRFRRWMIQSVGKSMELPELLEPAVVDRIRICRGLAEATRADISTLLAVELAHLEEELGVSLPACRALPQTRYSAPGGASIGDIALHCGVSVKQVRELLVSLNYMQKVGRRYVLTVFGRIIAEPMAVYKKTDATYRFCRWEIRWNATAVQMVKSRFDEAAREEENFKAGRFTYDYCVTTPWK